MLRDLLDRILDLSRLAGHVELVSRQDMPGKLGVRTGDKFEWIDTPPIPRQHTIHSLSDLITACRRIGSAIEVYHAESSVVALLNGEKRNERLTMPLVYTERFRSVRGLAQRANKLSVADAVRMIRFELNGTGVDKLLGSLSKINFLRTGDGAQSAEHGRETLGRSVEKAVQQADAVPQTFVATTPVFANEGLRHIIAKVTCGIYLDMDDECIQILPLADEIEAALNAAQKELHGLLVDNLGELVFRGAP